MTAMTLVSRGHFTLNDLNGDSQNNPSFQNEFEDCSRVSEIWAPAAYKVSFKNDESSLVLHVQHNLTQRTHTSMTQWRPHFFRLRSNFVEALAVAIFALRYFEATVLGCDMIDESLQAFLRLQQHTNSGLNFAELHLQRHPIFDSSASTKQDPRFNPCFRELQLIVIPSLPVWAVGPLSPINNHDFANMEWS